MNRGILTGAEEAERTELLELAQADITLQTLMVAATQHPPRSMKVGLPAARGECCVAATVK